MPPVRLSDAQLCAVEELLVELGVPLIVDGKRTADRIVDRIDHPERYLT